MREDSQNVEYNKIIKKLAILQKKVSKMSKKGDVPLCLRIEIDNLHKKALSIKR